MAIRRFLPRSDDRVMARDASQHEGKPDLLGHSHRGDVAIARRFMWWRVHSAANTQPHISCLPAHAPW